MCGSNNRTYESVCQMNEESVKIGNTVYFKHWGPCRSGKTLLSIWRYGSTGTSYYFLSQYLLFHYFMMLRHSGDYVHRRWLGRS